jgi:hypothetical protein
VKLNREQWKQLIPVLVLSTLGIVGAVYRNSDEVFGLTSNSDCKDYNTADHDYQRRFPDRCGCLHPEQANALGAVGVQNAVNVCFETAMKQCRGWEKIGRLYRGCVEKITGIIDK